MDPNRGNVSSVIFVQHFSHHFNSFMKFIVNGDGKTIGVSVRKKAGGPSVQNIVNRSSLVLCQ